MDSTIKYFGEEKPSDLFKKRKNVLAITGILLVIGLFAVIMFSLNAIPNSKKVLDNLAQKTADTRTVVSTPASDDPSIKTTNFSLANGDGITFKFSIKIPQGSIETSTPRDGMNSATYQVENNDYSLKFSTPSEVFEGHYDSKIDLGVFSNIGTNVYRVKRSIMEPKTMLYSNDTHLTLNTTCTTGTENTAPCGYPLLKIGNGSFNIVCKDKLGYGGFTICDSIIKTIRLEVL